MRDACSGDIKSYTVYIYIYSIPSDDGLHICPKHIEVDRRNKLKKNGAKCWFFFHTEQFRVVPEHGLSRCVLCKQFY